MPVLGQGIIPSGSIANELTAVTRRAFIPKLVVQLYNSTPPFLVSTWIHPSASRSSWSLFRVAPLSPL